MTRAPKWRRNRPEEVVAKPRQAGEALAKGTPISEAAGSLGVSAVILHRRCAVYGADLPLKMLSRSSEGIQRSRGLKETLR